MLLPEQPAGVLTWSNDDGGGNVDRFWVIPSAIDCPHNNLSQEARPEPAAFFNWYQRKLEIQIRLSLETYLRFSFIQ